MSPRKRAKRKPPEGPEPPPVRTDQYLSLYPRPSPMPFIDENVISIASVALSSALSYAHILLPDRQLREAAYGMLATTVKLVVTIENSHRENTQRDP